MKKFYTWMAESLARTYFSLAVLGAVLLAGSYSASAAWTTYDVVNAPQMFLGSSINATQTTGITVSALTRNGSTVTFPVTSGAILRIQQGSRVEDIYYGSATVNQTTKIVTLSGVIRNICWNVFNNIQTCGDGQAFGKGSIVELSTDARLFNLKANVDRANTFTALQTFGSGVTLSGTKFALRVTNGTTAQRDAIASPANGMLWYNTTTGLMNQYIAGAWSAIGTDATPIAGWNVGGKVELANIDELLGRRSTGSTLSTLAINPTHLTMSGGTTLKGFIPQIGTGGALASTLGATGVTSPASGGLLITQGANAFKLLKPTVGTESGSLVGWDGNEIKVGVPGQCKVMYNSVTDSDTLGVSTTSTQYFSKNYRIASGSYVVGDEWKIEAYYDEFGSAGSTGKVSFHWAGAFLSGTPSSADADRYVTAGFTVRSLGTSGSVMPFMQAVGNDTDANNTQVGVAGPKGINTASGAVINLAYTHDASDANHQVRLRTFKVTKCTPVFSN